MAIVADPEISIIVPALNEAENLPALAQRVDAALNGRNYEVLIVDDNSRDNTKDVARELAEKYPMRLLVRAQPKDGLGGAVLDGIRATRGREIVVMDADLQHPPEKLPELLAPIERNGADFALGSRYIPGGSTGEKWGLFRRINSRLATVLAKPFSGGTNDPMSGFFALKRETFDRAQRLTPLGYKIGLELMCKCRVKDVREVPIHFAERERGQSKLTLREQFRYLEHLSRLYDFTYPRLSPVTKFLIVTILSWLVGLGIYELIIQSHLQPALAAPYAYLAAILVTAVFHNRYVRAQREFLLTKHPWREFITIAVAELIACIVTASWLVRRVEHVGAIELFIISFGAATLTRYILRKEFMHDIRGLRRELRKEEMQ
ncbi:MAG TPA: polyprenol monophosphomannose synthase [Tepidisphaeraceae bacterium]|nr:polyprenol monophosphomannose synthase [Tepidisphaeraceae bacterium]